MVFAFHVFRMDKLAGVIQLLRQSAEVSHAVRVRVAEGADVQLVYDRVLIPEWVH